MVKTSNDAGVYKVDGIHGWKRVFDSKKDMEIYNTDVETAIKKKLPPAKWRDERVVIIYGGARDGEEVVESRLKPIPLTEEWLLKFGARKHETGFLLSLDPNTSIILEPTIYIEEGEGYDAFLMQTDGHTIQVNVLIKHVHQLQNYTSL